MPVLSDAGRVVFGSGRIVFAGSSAVSSIVRARILDTPSFRRPINRRDVSMIDYYALQYGVTVYTFSAVGKLLFHPPLA